MSPGIVYEGTIRHRRLAVRGHEFRHRIAMAYVELEGPEREAAAALVASHTGASFDGPVRKLTLPRRFGKGFNPVSFYYCFDPDECLQAVLAEVTSTPWGERHAYVLGREGEGPVLSGGSVKRLHVSPFMGMDQRYAWHVGTPGPTLSVHIESFESDELVFDATLNLVRAPAGRRRASSPWRVLALIYGHAVVLKLKGIPVHRHPKGAVA